MKKNTKLLVFILSVALLIGAAMSVSATEEAPAPEIMAKNVIYGADIRFQFAIDAADFGADKTITVKIYDANPAEGGALLDTSVAVYTDVTETNLGVDYAYIASSKAAVSAIAFGQEFWAVAECDGVQGTAIKYSAVEYFLERLYADADSITDIQKAHYQNAIAYGSTAQKVTGDTKTNVADYLYVMAKDGMVNGAEGAVVLKDDALNFTYTGAEDASGIAYWLDPAGNKTASATVSGTYSARFADFTFNDLSNNTVITPSASTGWQKVTWADGDKDVTKYKNLLINEIYKDNTRSQSYSIKDGALHYTTTGGMRFAFSNGNKSGNHTVFETDITITVPEGSTRNIGIQFYKTSVSTALYQMNMTYDARNGRIETWFSRNQAYTGVTYKDTSHIVTYVAEKGDTTASFNLKVESYYISATDDSVLVFSVNDKAVWILDSRGVDRTNAPSSDDQVRAYQISGGTYVCQYAFIEESSTDYTPRAGVFTCVMFNPNSGNNCDIVFDNIIFSTYTATAPTLNIEK